MVRNTIVHIGLATLVVIAASFEANAFSCIERETDVLQPPDGETDVPIDALLWVGGKYTTGTGDPPLALTLLDENGGIVETEQRFIVSTYDWVTVLVPASPLEPHATYELWSAEEPLSVFTTSDQVDLEPPEPPVNTLLADGETQLIEPLSSDVRSIEMELPGGGLFVLVDIQRESTLDIERIEGTVTDIEEDVSQVFVGQGGCENNWPITDPGEMVQFRFAAFDLSGNFSGWSEPMLAQDEVPAGCGCTQSTTERPRGAIAGAALLLAAWALTRRR